jgi:hypothetical protein
LTFGVRVLYEASSLNAAVIMRAVSSNCSNTGMRNGGSQKQNTNKNGNSNSKAGSFHLLSPDIRGAFPVNDLAFNTLSFPRTEAIHMPPAYYHSDLFMQIYYYRGDPH